MDDQPPSTEDFHVRGPLSGLLRSRPFSLAARKTFSSIVTSSWSEAEGRPLSRSLNDIVSLDEVTKVIDLGFCVNAVTA